MVLGDSKGNEVDQPSSPNVSQPDGLYMQSKPPSTQPRVTKNTFPEYIHGRQSDTSQDRVSVVGESLACGRYILCNAPEASVLEVGIPFS